MGVIFIYINMITDLIKELKAKLPFKYTDGSSFHKEVAQEFEFYISKLKEIDTKEYAEKFKD